MRKYIEWIKTTKDTVKNKIMATGIISVKKKTMEHWMTLRTPHSILHGANHKTMSSAVTCKIFVDSLKVVVSSSDIGELKKWEGWASQTSQLATGKDCFCFSKRKGELSVYCLWQGTARKTVNFPVSICDVCNINILVAQPFNSKECQK